MDDLTQAVAAADQPQAIHRALADLAQATVGFKLFTLMALDPVRGVARRSFSTMAEAYPVSGEKPLTPNAWSAQVIDRQEIFVANSIDEIAEVFPDHALIRALGCESCLNLPVPVAGRVIGTLNCLHVAGHYTPDRVAAAEALRLPGALAFLLAAHSGAAPRRALPISDE